MLEICHVNKTFNRGTVNEKQALKDLNLTLRMEILLRSSAETAPESLRP